MTCQAIHDPLNCLQYQDQLELDAELTDEAKKTKAFLEVSHRKIPQLRETT